MIAPSFKKINLSFFVVLTVTVMVVSSARAQTPTSRLYLSWNADTYAPSLYLGKRLAVGGANVTVGAEVVRDGRPIDFSGQTVRWYMEDELIASGKGLGRASFRLPDIAGGTVDVRAELPDMALVQTITIRLGSPLVVIQSPFGGGEFRGDEATFSSEAYFFNVTDASRLLWEWRVNGQPPETSEKPDLLTVRINPGTAEGYPIGISLRLKNPRKTFESASQNLSLTYRP